MSLVKPSRYFELTTQILNEVNGRLDTENFTSQGLDGGRVLRESSVTDDRLESPNNAVYRHVMDGAGLDAGQPAGKYFLGNWRDTGSSLIPLNTNITGDFSPAMLIYFDPADYAVAGLTLHCRVRGQTFSNVAMTGRSYTFGFAPISAVTTTGADIGLTQGTVRPGSTASIIAPGATTLSEVNSGDFTMVTASWWALVVNITGAAVANQRVILTAQLQMHHS